MDGPLKLERVLSQGMLDDDPGDLEYWLSRPPGERLAALEQLRQLTYGYDPATTRIQRVLEFAELDRG
jgi:hypothetical protein